MEEEIVHVCVCVWGEGVRKVRYRIVSQFHR